jgi:arabinogalactan oligomer / maltooligosaccharide transport system substrate-binding protein
VLGATLPRADLRSAILSNADLAKANLSHASLGGADLSAAILSSTDLSDANLTNATVSGARLDSANLTRANLAAASLNGADLSNARLNDADLSGDDLTNATLTDADVTDADLSDADLVGAASQPQLDRLRSCTNAKVDEGLKCNHQPAITLTYWYTESPPEQKVVSNLIDTFENDHPAIKIKREYVPFFRARDKFITASQDGTAPDILRSDSSWVSLFASRRYLSNIDTRVPSSDLADYRSGPLGSAPLGSNQYNGHLYGLPQVNDFLALIYNKKYIPSPPITMAEFEYDAESVTTPGKYGFETNGSSYYTLPFLWGFGGGMMDDDNRTPLVNNPGSKAGLEFLLRLQNQDKVMPARVGARDMVQDFMTGKTAMIIDGPWDVSKILTDPSSIFAGNRRNLGIAGIPTCPPGVVTCDARMTTGSPIGGQSYVISAGTGHPDAAYDFIDFMNSAKSQASISNANHTLPTRGSAYLDSSGSVSHDDIVTDFRSIAHTARARPSIPQGAYLFDALDPNIRAALRGTQNPDSALDAVAAAWNRLLNAPPADTHLPLPDDSQAVKPQPGAGVYSWPMVIVVIIIVSVAVWVLRRRFRLRGAVAGGSGHARAWPDDAAGGASGAGRGYWRSARISPGARPAALPRPRHPNPNRRSRDLPAHPDPASPRPPGQPRALS